MTPDQADAPSSLDVALRDRLVAAEGDASLERWFRREIQPHEPALRGFLRRQFPGIADVDDVVQESYLRLLQRRAGASPVTSVKSYLFAIARNTALGLFRRRRRSPVVAWHDPERLAEVRGPGDVVADVALGEDLALATAAIDGLPPRCREIFILWALHDVAQPEIAARLGISICTVRAQLATGMRRCMEHVARRRKER